MDDIPEQHYEFVPSGTVRLTRFGWEERFLRMQSEARKRDMERYKESLARPIMQFISS